MKCYICETAAPHYHIKVEQYSIYKCPNCGLEYTYPKPMAEFLGKFYQAYSDIRCSRAVSERNAIHRMGILANAGWDWRYLTCDFGCGDGIFVQKLGPYGYGIDINPIECSVIDQEHMFITMWGVLEHLVDPRGVLEILKSKLCWNGRIILTTVNAEGDIPYYYKPPEHLTYWTQSAIEILAAQVGMTVCKWEQYGMYQAGGVYMDRVLSRTPWQIRTQIEYEFDELIFVPTNEILCILENK